MRRPVFWLGLCYLAGETLGLVITPDYTWVIALGMFIVIAIMLWMRLDYRKFTGRRSGTFRHISGWFLVLPVFLFIGYLSFSSAMCDALEKDSALCQVADVNICGKVWSVEEKDNCFYVYVKTADGTFLAVVMKDDMSTMEWISGYVVEISGTLECFNVPTNEGMFNEWLYYHARDVDARIWVDSIRFVCDESRFMDRWMWKLKSYIAKNCRQYLSEKASGVAISMLTGDRGELDKDINELYQLTGIAHILAISGLHISFIGMGLYSVLRRMGVHPGICAVLGVSSLVFYGIFTGMAPSTLRAVIMTGLHVVAKGWGYCYDRKTAYGLAILIVLFDAPLMITQPGFMLSFGAVGCLIFSERFLPKYIKHAKGKVKWRNKVLNTLIPSFSVTIGMMPLTALNFSAIPLYGMFLNLLVIPLMSILYPAMLLCGLFSGYLGAMLQPVYWCIEGILMVYEVLCRWSLTIPGSIVTCGRPGMGLLVGIYGGMFLFLWCVQRLQLAPFIKRAAVIFGCMMPLMLLVNGWSPTLKVTMLDVGQGDCFLISLPSGEHILVDGGSSDVKNVGEYRLIPYLKACGIDTLDAVFLSHLDADHTSAVLELLKAQQKDTLSDTVDIKQIIVPLLEDESDSKDKLVQLLNVASERCLMAKAGDKMAFSDLTVRVLWPDKSNVPKDSNEGSMVLFMEYQGMSMLFTGDVGEGAENAILEHLEGRPCHILKVAHHGSKHSTSLDFLQHLSPKVALISAGEDNAYGHPHDELLERLEGVHASVYNTADLGQVTLSQSQKNIKVVVWKDNGVYNRYRSALGLKE